MVQLEDEYFENGKTLKSDKFTIIFAKISMEKAVKVLRKRNFVSDAFTRSTSYQSLLWRTLGGNQRGRMHDTQCKMQRQYKISHSAWREPVRTIQAISWCH